MTRSSIPRLAVAWAALLVAAVPIAPAHADGGTPPSIEAVPPASKRIYMVSDSVGLGAKTAMPKAFPSDWQVTVDGTPALFVEQLLSKHVLYREATAPSVFGDYAIVAGGYNYPYWDPARFDRSVDAMVNELVRVGTKHVYWVTLREVKQQYVTASAWKGVQPYYWYFPEVNVHLRAALARHPELSLIDWASIADRPGLTADAIHLNTLGAAEYSGLAAATVLNSITRRPAGNVTEITVAGVGGVPADAAAVALNLTVVGPRTSGFLTAYPCGGSLPVVSNLNYDPSETVASSAIVPVGVDGKVCVYQWAPANIVIDITGAFTVASGFVPITPVRSVDTRTDPGVAPGLPLTVHVAGTTGVSGMPANPAAAVLNVTTVGTAEAGDVFVFPCGAPQPTVPSGAFLPGRTNSILVVAALDSNGDVCVTVSKAVFVIVDVFGAFAEGADVHPVAPSRLLDTRTGGAMPNDAVLVQQVGTLGGLPPTPVGAMLTVTLYQPSNQGYATPYPCTAPRPLTSMVNVVPNRTRLNSSLVALDWAGWVCIYMSASGHATIDVTGWMGAAFTPLTPVRLVDTRIP